MTAIDPKMRQSRLEVDDLERSDLARLGKIIDFKSTSATF